MLPLPTFSSAPSGRPDTEAMPSTGGPDAPPVQVVAEYTRAGVSTPLLVENDSTQREPEPETWPNRMPMLLPAFQPGIDTISFNIDEISGVVSSSWTLTDGSGDHDTAAAVGVRFDRSLFVSVGAAALAFFSP